MRKRLCIKKYEVVHVLVEAIGQRIRKLRTQNCMTQKALAEVLYVSHRTISSWELGKTEPDIVSIIKLSLLFRISLDCLLIREKNSFILGQYSYRGFQTTNTKDLYSKLWSRTGRYFQVSYLPVFRFNDL